MQIIGGKDRKLVQRVTLVMAGVLLIGLLVGTFFDSQISTATVMPNNPIAQVISAIGLFPICIPLCITFGAMLQRTIRTNRPQVFRICVSAVILALGCYTGFAFGKSFLNYDGIGPFLPFSVPTVAIVVFGILVGLAFMALGYMAATRNDEASLLRTTIVVAVLLAGSFLLVEVFKGIMHRPRPRAIALGYEGVEFTPWYRPFKQYAELMQKYGLDSDSFKSFPSGHSVQAGITLVSYYALAALYPTMRGKWRMAILVQIAFVVFVPLSRIVLAAHFLSDVCVGACIAVLAGAYLFFSKQSEPSAKGKQE